jgi:hypothetical protein
MKKAARCCRIVNLQNCLKQLYQLDDFFERSEKYLGHRTAAPVRMEPMSSKFGTSSGESFLDFRGDAGQNFASVGQYVVSPSPRPSKF